MDASRYRIRALQAADIDTALELMRQANPVYDAQRLKAHRHLLELTTAPEETRPSESALRAMAHDLAGPGYAEEDVYRLLAEKASAGLLAGALQTLVAEERVAGRVVGLVNAGAPGKWAHHAISQLPAPMVQQLRERVVEISDIAVEPASRRQGIGAELMNALLDSGSERAQAWRLAIWFFHEGAGMGGFHRAMAPEWPVGKPIAFLDSDRNLAHFRALSGDLRACVVPLHPDVKLVMSPEGAAAIQGVFDQPWPQEPGARGSVSRSKPSKAERKREKKMRGRSRG